VFTDLSHTKQKPFLKIRHL